MPLNEDPFVRALYGHPESGALWDAHLGAILVKLGWKRMEVHPKFWLHASGAVLAVYVIPEHALHEKGSQRQIGVVKLVSSQERRTAVAPRINWLLIVDRG